MTYAKKKAREVIAQARAIPTHWNRMEELLAALIASVIEDCAAQCEDASTVGDFYAKRIRSLSTPVPKEPTR